MKTIAPHILASTTLITTSLLMATPAFAGAEQDLRNSSVTEKTYKVTMKGDEYASLDKLREKALYKAAKKTDKKDYEWFQIVDIDSSTRSSYDSNDIAVYHRAPVRTCGLLGCATSYSSQPAGYKGSSRFGDKKPTHKVTVKYHMGSGPSAQYDHVYFAKDILAGN